MNKRGNPGFTLIELLVVMAIMLMLMGIGTAGYFGARRGAEMRGAVSTVRTTLMLARQQAVTKRKPVTVEFVSVGETNLLRVTSVSSTGDVQTVHREGVLPLGIKFDPLPGSIVFTPVGVAGSPAAVQITVKEVASQAGAPAATTIRVWPLTGITKVE